MLLVCKFHQARALKHGAFKSGVTLGRCRAHGELPYMSEFLFVWARPLFQAPGGSELAGVLLGIKPGPRAGKERKKKAVGVYCSCGCLEVTGSKHARFVKMNRGQGHKTDNLFIQGEVTGTTLAAPRELHKHGIHVCALETVMNSPTYIQNLLKIPFGG